MQKTFNVAGICIPEKNYMVDISERVELIKTNFVVPGKYFTINRARQYGKTTTLFMLEKILRHQFLVLSLSFEAADDYFVSLHSFAEGFSLDIADCLYHQEAIGSTEWENPISERFPLRDLGKRITHLCENCDKKVVLIIDEVDKNSDNQIFMSFLGLLRAKYLDQSKGKDTTFWSVILSGVYDVKNLKQKLHPGEESKYNSPWNIAADFDINMNFSIPDIAGMLRQYESDHRTGMDIDTIADLLYDYTSGYPFLVSRLCKLMDEKLIDTFKNPSDFQVKSAETIDFSSESCVSDNPEKSSKTFRIPSESCVSDNPASQSTCNSSYTKNTFTRFTNQSEVWTKAGILRAVNILLYEKNSLFESLIGKLNDYPEMKKLIYRLLFQGETILYNADDIATDMLLMFGFAKAKNGTLQIANRIFETRLYNYFLAKPEAQNGEMFRTASKNKNVHTYGYIINGGFQ